MAVFVICVGLVAVSIATGAGSAASNLLAAGVALFTFSFLPSKTEVMRRAQQRHLEIFHESAAAIGNRPDALPALEERRSTLGLSADDVVSEMRAIRQWQTEKRRQMFVSIFAREFPTATIATLEELARLGNNEDLATVVSQHLESIDAAKATLVLQQRIATRGALPVLEDTTGAAGADAVHFASRTLFDRRGPNDERGTLMLTDRRVLFIGAKPSSVAWNKVRSVKRDGPTLLIQREDRQTPWVFCFDRLKDSAAAELLGQFLIGQRHYQFVGASELFVVPTVSNAPALPVRAISQKGGNDALKATAGLSLAAMVVAMGFVPTPPVPARSGPTPTGSLATAPILVPPKRTVTVAIPNVAFVVVSPDLAAQDNELWRIARELHPPNLPPTEIMFWTEPEIAPIKFPLTTAQTSRRVAVISMGLKTGDRLLRREPRIPSLER